MEKKPRKISDRTAAIQAALAQEACDKCGAIPRKVPDSIAQAFGVSRQYVHQLANRQK